MKNQYTEEALLLAQKILQYASYLDPDFISMKIFQELFKMGEDELRIAVDVLESSGAAERTSNTFDEQGLRMRQLTQESNLIENESSYEIKLKLLETFDMLFSSDIVSDDFEKSDRLLATQYVSHIGKLLKNTENLEPVNPVAASLNIKMGNYYRNLTSDYNCALDYYNKGLEILRVVHNNEPHPDLANLLNGLGLTYRSLGGEENVQKGLKMQEQALEMRQILYPDQPHPDFARSLNNLGYTYQSLGGEKNLQKGLKLLEQALEMRQILYPDQPHPDLTISLNNVGLTYQRLGGEDNLKKALQLLEQALEINQTLYPDQPHPHLARSLNSLGYTYQSLGREENIQKGLQLMEQALEMNQTLYPDQSHPDLAISLNNVGQVYLNLGGEGSGKKALQLLEQALEMMQILYPDQPHPDLANYVAISLHSSWANRKARHPMESTLELERKILSQELEPLKQDLDILHLDLANQLNDKASEDAVTLTGDSI